MAREIERFDTVAEFAKEANESMWSEEELCEAVLAFAPLDSSLYTAAVEYKGAVMNLEYQLIKAGYAV